jgi:hypothetical protein
MRQLLARAPENRRSHVGHSKWPQIAVNMMFQLCVCALLLISGGVLQASDSGQLVWKEQRGMMRAAEIGVVVWKEQPFHSDASSKAFAYDRMKQAGPITWFYNGATNKSFEKHELFQQIRFPQWPLGEIVEQQEFESLKLKLGELEAFAQKYPNAAALLDGIAGSMRDAVSKFSFGKVFFSGNWITREEYEKLADQRNDLLKRYAEEREVLESKLKNEEELALKARQEARARQLSQWILAGGGVWLLLLLVALLTRSWGTVMLLIFALLGVAGWFTYSGSGFGWAEHVERAVKDLPSLLTFTK